jgi:hypothetical protein
MKSWMPESDTASSTSTSIGSNGSDRAEVGRGGATPVGTNIAISVGSVRANSYLLYSRAVH